MPVKEKERQKALERDGSECKFCGMTNEEHKEEHDKGLHAHHIVKERANGSDGVDNLIIVCYSCHKTLEKSQAEALERIKKSETRADEIEELTKENYELQRVVDSLISEVHHLSRFVLNDRRTIDEDAFEGYYIDVETVSDNFGRRCGVTTDPEEAKRMYDEWGGRINRNSVKVTKDVSKDMVEQQLERVPEDTASIFSNKFNR